MYLGCLYFFELSTFMIETLQKAYQFRFLTFVIQQSFVGLRLIDSHLVWNSETFKKKQMVYTLRIVNVVLQLFCFTESDV